MAALVLTEKIPQLHYGRRLLRRGILADLMSQMGQYEPSRLRDGMVGLPSTADIFDECRHGR